MNTSTDSIRLAPEVRAAVGAFLRKYRPGEGPFAISEAIHAVRRTYPVMELSDGDLTAAIARQAIAAGLNIHFDGAGRYKPSRIPRQWG